MGNPGDPEEPIKEDQNDISAEDDDDVVVLNEDEVIDDFEIDEAAEEVADELDDMVVDDRGPEQDTPLDQSAITFSKHKGSVFSVAASPTSALVASGGEDDLGYVWDINTGEEILVCSGHTDSVTHVSFNHDGKLLATADMAGNIQVWSMADRKQTWQYESGVELQWMQWFPAAANILFVGDSDGSVYFWLMPSAQLKLLAGPGAGQTTCAAFSNDNKGLLVGYEDGSVRLWDLKDTSVRWTWSQPVNNSTCILSLAVHPSGPLVACGTENGNALLLHAEKGTLLAELKCTTPNTNEGDDEGMSADQNSSVESLLFIDSYLLCGCLDGSLSCWETSSHKQRARLVLPTGVTRFRQAADRLLVACLDGSVCELNPLSCELLRRRQMHSATVLDLTVHKPTNLLITSSDDSHVRTWNLN